MQHQCKCGTHYLCAFCGGPMAFVCPTVNNDPEAHLCPECLSKTVDEMIKEVSNMFNAPEREFPVRDANGFFVNGGHLAKNQ